MSDPLAIDAVLTQARDAASAGRWQQAYELLLSADERSSLSPPDLAFLADVAYAAGHLDVTIASWERAYGQCVRENDGIGAAGAAVRVAMHLLFDTALMAPVRGWLKRTEQHLEGHPETPIHAWLAVVRNYERLLSGDLAEARQWARRAVEIGATCAPEAAAIGRIAEARNLILDGDVEEGVAMLNDAAEAAVSGELDPLSTGIVYCEVVCALQGLAQYDLAEQWTEAMEHWRQGQPVGSVHGRCRVHRAEILRLRGACAEAEQEALRACEELRPYLRREFGWPLSVLGLVRLRIGDLTGAEAAFVEAHAAGWDPQPGLALVYLAQGRTEIAVALIREALENPPNVPSKELPPSGDLRRAPLLDALVEIALAVGDLDDARVAAEELARVAERFRTKALVATADLSRGRVARAGGDLALARRCLEEAARGWNDVGAPYEAAVARMELGHVLGEEGNEERAALEFAAARTLFERAGAVNTASANRAPTVQGEPASQVSAVTQSAEVPSHQCVFHRAGDYWSITFEGSTIRLRDLKGLRYLARLLSSPGHELHVLDLVATEAGAQAGGKTPGLSARVGMDAGAFLDREAKESYRRRLGEIEQDLEEAREIGDIERAAQAQREREFLVRELARAVGLGGRDRRATSTAERARASVTRAIRQAMDRIEQHHPALGRHLNSTVRTGTFCTYVPDSRIGSEWVT